MKKINTFLAGCQKTGSTWLYNCFMEHPEICVPTKDAIHYFTINHYEGLDWYNKWFNPKSTEKIICDTTPSYIRDASAAKRIFDYNPDAKLLFVLRNPIERSFSHYWHQKRKGKVNYHFDSPLHYNEVGNYDLYEMWINSSMYYKQLLPYFDLFDSKQIKIMLYDDLISDSNNFLKEIFKFIGVNPSFEPSVKGKKINSAPTNKSKEALGGRNRIIGEIKKLLLIPKTSNNSASTDEYKKGISEQYRITLNKVFQPEIKKLSSLINIDLSHWN